MTQETTIPSRLVIGTRRRHVTLHGWKADVVMLAITLLPGVLLVAAGYLP
ncbi:hypothetical protein [Falsiroseomonas sp. CW058]